MKTLNTLGLTALAIGVMSFTQLTYAADNRTWDGKAQDDPSHFQHKPLQGVEGGQVLGRSESQPPINGANSRTWDGKAQDDSSHFRNGHGVYGRSAAYDIGNPSVHEAVTTQETNNTAQHGVYGRSAVYDIGNPSVHKAVATQDTNNTAMPCHEKMTMEECHKMMMSQ